MFGSQNDFKPHCLSYGEGYTGTLRLRTAMAAHLNTRFHPSIAIDAEEITFAAGVTALNEACALVTCDPDEAILLGRPTYGAFWQDMTTRTG
jgi:1-aminocyclopropane-1-carboxylate synthase